MPFSANGKNRMLTGFKGGTTSSSIYASLHSAYSAVGASEVSTAGGTYSRKAITWNSPSSGTMAISTISPFSLPAGAQTAFVGLWDDSVSTSSANFLGMWAIGGTPLEYYLNGTDSYINSPAHGLSNDNQIILLGTTRGGGLATSADTLYYVTASETGRFRIATGTGGTGTVTFSDLTQMPSSDAYVTKVLVDTYVSGGTFTVNSFDIALPF